MIPFAILVSIVFGVAIIACIVVGILDEHRIEMERQNRLDEDQSIRIGNS